MNVVEMKQIQLKKNQTEILKNVSVTIPQGEIFGLIGHNGAGKTSLLRILLGLTVGYQGSVRLFEQDDLSAARSLMGAVTDNMRLEEKRTAKQYMSRVCYMLGRTSKDECCHLLNKVGLQDTCHKQIRTFSLGMKRRLEIAVSMAGSPKLLVLDEPFNGIDPRGMSELRLLLQQLCQEGVTILVTSHIISELLKLATIYGVMYQGNYLGSYTRKELKDTELSKTVFQTEGMTADSIEAIRQKYPKLYCTSDAMGEITILGNLSGEFYEENKGLHMLKHDRAGEEEILLWKMNGFGI